MIGTLFWIAVGAAAMFFFDPERGAKRRNMARDRFMSTARDVQHEAERAARDVASTAEDVAQKAKRELSAAGSSAASTAEDVAQKVQQDLSAAGSSVASTAEDVARKAEELPNTPPPGGSDYKYTG